MTKIRIGVVAAVAMLVAGTAASLGQMALGQTALPPGLPPGTPPVTAEGAGLAMPPPFMMPPWLVGAGAGGPPSPQAMCLETIARRAGTFAYLRQRLALTPAQAPLWRDVEAAVDETTIEARAECAVLPATPGKPALPAMLSFADRHLASRQQGLQRLSGPLLRLYESLSLEQRAVMDRAVPPPMIL